MRNTKTNNIAESKFKLFKKQVRLAVKAADDLSEKNIRFSLNYRKGEGGSVSVSLPDEKEIARFAVIVHPLVSNDSEINVKTIALKLLDLVTKADKKSILGIIKNFEKIENGFIKVKYCNNDYTAKEMFADASKKYFFAQGNPPSSAEPPFDNQILAKFLIYNFYNYCFEGYNLASHLFGIMNKIRVKQEVTINDCEEFSCIFCKKQDRPFTSFEHIFPESLGNVELVLEPGTVCDVCNNGVLSQLDKTLVEFDPISFLRTIHLPYIPKTGKFPSAVFRNMKIEKTHPQKLIMKPNHDKQLKIRKEGDQVHIKGTFVGRKKFYPKTLARSLFKIALEIVALTEGAEKALEERYDAARKFILNGGDFNNYLAMNQEVNTEDPSISYHYQSLQKGSAFGLTIFGLIFLFNLEEEPLLIEDEISKSGFKVYPLFN